VSFVFLLVFLLVEKSTTGTLRSKQGTQGLFA
jgi:hypothetical protein